MSLPRKILVDEPEAERRRWRIVRLDTHETVPGLILSADCDSGVCTLSVFKAAERQADGTLKEEFKTMEYSLGANGFAIIAR
jgi:hypothetical protein